MRGSHIVYFNKRLFEFNGLYADSFGMIVSDFEYKETNMENFKLSASVLREIRRMLVENRQATHIIQASMSENKMFQPMYF